VDPYREVDEMEDLLIVGNGRLGVELASMLMRRKKGCLRGFVCDTEKGYVEVDVVGKRKKVPVLGRPTQISKTFFDQIKVGAPKIVLTLEEERDAEVLRRISQCIRSGIEVEEGSDIYETFTKKIPVRYINEKWLVKGLGNVGQKRVYLFFKRVFDVVASFIGIVLLLPLFLLVGLAIKLDSEGPVIYKQRRIGKNGRPFTMYKFRTMTKDADVNGGFWTRKDDPRITRVGKILRRFRIDELPQLINVLKGDMSLVGPRPEPEELVERCEEHIPFYGYRFYAKPGITGWAQVSYPYTDSIEGTLEKLQYDLYWVKHCSFLFDLKIIFKSIWIVLTGKGVH